MKSVLNVKGQATVEAILMLVLGVAMVLGLMKGFSASFSKFTEVYFGSYFSCLIEQGELPRLKYAGGKGVCDKEHKPFSLSEGWAKNIKSSGSDKGSGSGEGKTKKSSPAQSVGESGSGENRFSVNRGRGGSSFGGSGGGDSKEKKKDSDGGYGGSGVGTYGNLSNGNDGVVRIIRIKKKSKGEKGSSYGLYKDPGDKKIKIKGSIKKSEVGSGGAKNGRLKISKTVAKVKEKKEKGLGFSFSGIMRFLIIAALIIVIIIVIGGQLLSISKSFE